MITNIYKYFLIPFLLLALLSCTTDTTEKTSNQTQIDYGYDRAHNPWVFRSVLDEKPRMITLALNENLWLAYSTQNCAIYKAWKGFVNFDGAVYNTVHGPQPNTIGDAFFVNEFDNPWVATKDGAAQELNIQYRGHSFVKGQVEMNYEFTLPDGKKFTVSEKPEYTVNDSGLKGLERNFEVKGLPQGIQLALKTNISSISGSTEKSAEQANFKTNGKLNIDKIEERKSGDITAIDLNGQLVLNSNESTKLTAYFVKKPLIENKNKLANEEELDKPLGYKLIARNDCKSCHNTMRKTIGPSYLSVARKYDNTEANIAMLTEKVKYGGAGVWGTTMMNAHPNVDDLEIKAMVEYIMTLDSEEEKIAKSKPVKKQMAFTAAADVITDDLLPGLRLKFVRISEKIKGLDDVNFKKRIEYEGIVPNIDIIDADLSWAGDWFGMQFDGYIDVPKDNNYLFRLSSDDGSRFYLDNQLIIDNDGFHGTDSRDGEMALKAGLHPIKVTYFQGSGGKTVNLSWKSFDDPSFKSVGPASFMHHKKEQAVDVNKKSPPLAATVKIPGDQFPLANVHPSFDLFQARPATFLPKVAGMDFKANGKLAVSTWDAGGEVHLITNPDAEDPGNMKVKTIARGLAEPLGLKVVDDVIYVLQKQELTKLIDNNGDEIIDEYITICNAWDVSANFHEFAFGLEEKDGWLYGNLAIGILPGGASAPNQPQHRGRTFRVEIATGNIEFVTSGLRTPNGVGIGVDNELFVSDNQGDWLPACKIMHVEKDAWYGSRAVDFEGTAEMQMKDPVVWLPQDEIGNSPSQITYLDKGPYKGQMIHGEVTHGGLKRVFAEKVNDQYQGAVFRFVQGLEAGVNRMCWGPDEALYIGGVGSTGNWGHSGKLWYGLQKIKYNNKSTFEMLAIRAQTNGIEIEFTEPLREGQAWDENLFNIEQWYYKPTADYGGPKLDQKKLIVKSSNLSDDRTKVFLEIDGIKEKYVIYVRLKEHIISAKGNELHSTEAWYTMNNIPKDKMGKVVPNKNTFADNTLTEGQKKAGWNLLFDGKTTKGWKNFKKETIGSSWVVENGALSLATNKKPDGAWQVKDGGDIICENVYTNFEFELEWKIQSCGNSGIMYLVSDSDEYDYPWMTGPEMQILDNTCHPDAKIIKHRAGDLYDVQSCKYETVKPAGEWNKARVVVKNGKLEHWLNGIKVVETEMWTETWTEKLKSTKWKDYPAYSTKKSGKIALQDHGDRVWFKNIKIREL